MLWAHINRDKKEWSFGNFYNAQASALAKGDWVAFDLGTQVDGNRTVQPIANGLTAVVGVAIGAVPAGDYGRFQTYGYQAEALVTNSTDQAITAGDSLKATASADYLSWAATGGAGSALQCAVAAEDVDTAAASLVAAALVKVIVKTL